MTTCEDGPAQNKEKMNRKRGGHLEQSKVKIGILEFVLQNDGPILESKIREFVVKSYAIKDQKTVNTHLHDLKGLGCIERIFLKKGLPNYWDITKIKHLKNIKLCFKKIKLNELEKSLNILLQENGYSKPSENGYYMT